MSIRTLCFSSILPVFLVLAAATGAVVYVVETRETEWGLMEEARGICVVVAEFLSEDVPGIQSQNKLPPDIQNSLNKILEHKSARRITALAGHNGHVFFDVGPEAGNDMPEQTIIKECIAGNNNVTRIEQVSKGSEAVFSCSPIHNAKGSTSGYLLVQTDASPLVAARARIIRTISCGTAASLGMGLLCALMVSSLLRKNIRTFAITVENTSLSDTGTPPPPPGNIREIHDLWNTFMTAASVLKDTESRTQRELMDVEMFRTSQDLARAYKRNRRRPSSFTGENIEIRTFALAEDNISGIATVVQKEKSLYAIAGTLSKQPHPMETAINASAATTMLEQELGRIDIQEALELASRVFALDYMLGAEYSSDNRSLKCAEYSSRNRSVAVRTAGHEETTILLHKEKGEPGKNLDLYKKTFAKDPIDELAANIIAIAKQYSVNPEHPMLLIRRTPGKGAAYK